MVTNNKKAARSWRSMSALPALPLALIAQGIGAQQSSDTEATDALEVVIVQAQKRSESGQDVPIAVSVLDDETMDALGLSAIQQLTDSHPSVYFDTAQSFQRNSLKIRGIGTIGNSRSFEGAVGVFVDGVYRPRSGMVLLDMLDIDRLEVLRGPQGTLFGKNTVAGTIALYSPVPELGNLAGDVELRAGDHSSRFLNGSLTVPVAESVALRFAAQVHQRDGFFQSPDNGDDYDSVDQHGIKAQLRFNPNDDLDVQIIADFAESDADCCWSAAIAVEGPTAPLIDFYGTLNGLTYVPPPVAERDRLESLNTLPKEHVEDNGLTGIVRLNREAMSFASITSVREWNHEQIDADADFSPADLFVLNEPTDIDSFSQEFNVGIDIGRTDLLLGLYYSEEDFESVRSVETGADADNYLNALISADLGAVACLPPVFEIDCIFPTGIEALLPNGEFTREHYWQNSKSTAAFAHASTRLGGRFALVSGLRYSIEDKEGGVDNLFWYDSAIARATLAAAGLPDDGTPRNGLDVIGTFYGPTFSDSVEDKETTGTISLQHFTSDNLMIYGGYHRGYKAGGVNLFREGAITDKVYRPETARSYEIGLKAQYLEGRARTNVAIFDTDFTDLQINFFTGLEFRTVNTGSATSSGIEIENLFRLTDRLQLGLAVSFLDARFGDLQSDSLSYLDGRDTPRAPDRSAVATLDYALPLRNGMALIARGKVAYSGDHFTGADVAVEQKSSSYLISDISVGLEGQNGRWEALLWCRNCGDQDYRTIYFNSTFQPGSYSAYLNPPQQVGFTFRTRFSE